MTDMTNPDVVALNLADTLRAIQRNEGKSDVLDVDLAWQTYQLLASALPAGMEQRDNHIWWPALNTIMRPDRPLIDLKQWGARKRLTRPSAVAAAQLLALGITVQTKPRRKL